MFHDGDVHDDGHHAWQFLNVRVKQLRYSYSVSLLNRFTYHHPAGAGQLFV
jgi:hypothetical protein